jgi:hypothetical protein
VSKGCVAPNLPRKAKIAKHCGIVNRNVQRICFYATELPDCAKGLFRHERWLRVHETQIFAGERFANLIFANIIVMLRNLPKLKARCLRVL